MAVLGYNNLASELQFLGRLTESREAWARSFELAERFGFRRLLRIVRFEASGWAYAEGRDDEALGYLDELIAELDAGLPSYSDPLALSIRAWIRLERGDAAGADRDSARAAELAAASDAQAQAAAYTVRGVVALALGRRTEADERATELVALGPVLLPALCEPFPNLAEVAWLFHDLGREQDFTAVLDATPIPSPWIDAARAIVGDEIDDAIRILERLGHSASLAHARRRAAERLAREA
jgi:tetratricopeptide (TPR) repeat protein